MKKTLGLINKKRKRGDIEFDDMDEQQKIELHDEDVDLDLKGYHEREAE